MKKITFLLLTIFYCIVGYSQFPQNFEDPAVVAPSTFPTGWLVTDNGVGTGNSWSIATNAAVIINGTKSAFMNREEIGALNTSEDWLISPSTVIPTNGQLRFFTKQSLVGNNGTIYQIRISSGTNAQNALGSYTVLKQWTEAQLNNVFNVAEEKVVDFPTAAAGTNLYIAFVRVYTQPTVPNGPLGGDRWSVDDINVVQKCIVPIGLTTGVIAATTANLSWNVSAGSQGYDIGIILATQNFAGVVTASSATNSLLATGLTQNTAYKSYVRSNCGNGNYSEWVGPFNFSTLAIGTSCTDPLVIGALPYQTIDNTGNYGNTLAGPQLASCISGGVNYQSGNDVFYSYTAAANCVVSFKLNSPQTRSSIFIYPSCAGLTGACLAGVGDATAAPRVINYAVTQGVTYIIVISSNNQTPTVGYNLLIQCEGCTTKPTNLTVTNPTLNGATFNWTAPAAAVIGYQVAVQAQGALVPQGSGQYSSTGPSLTLTTELATGTLLEYWVRSECSPGVFSAWQGPILFNTQLCAPAAKCTYVFRMTDTGNNGWNGALMQVRQNGIIIATIGSTFGAAQGGGPIDVPVSLCNGGFEVFWITAGSQPQQCVVSVINKFGQMIATINGATVTPGTQIYAGVVNCDQPLCSIAPTNVAVTNITINSATVNWTAPATEGVGYDIYLVSAGEAAPSSSTVPTFSGANGLTPPFSFSLTSLLADTSYDVYVRVQCAQFSPWSVVKTFKTLPTCPKPTNQTVTGITTTSAVLGWTEAASATQWEVLLIPAPNGVAPAAPNVALPYLPSAGDIYLQGLTGLTANTPTNLAPATIYYYFVRAVCQGNDASTWTGPKIFNTTTCAQDDKCKFKFLLTNTTNNSWNGGRIQVRQNGIVVETLGAGGVNNTSGINVFLCSNVPYDLFWSIPGTAPEGMGLTIITPNLDVAYTKVAGVGSPLTVLFSDSSLGNCATPTCPKPVNLLVNSATQTTATLSWTETGSATAWEVYVVAEGGMQPVNGAPLNTGVAGYYSADSSTFTTPLAPGLIPGTKYEYYVRAICSSSDLGTWTILTPKGFITKPVNDECSAAITVPVNLDRLCAQTVSGNTLGGTESSQISTCSGSENDDVWFTFTATSNIHIVSLLNITGTTTDLRFAVYEGACSSTSQIFCSSGTPTPNGSVITNLTVGFVYNIRVYTNGNNINQSASFNVCVSTPPAPGLNDECANAIVITVNTLSECAFVKPGNLIGATASIGVPGACIGTINDDVWFKFVATSTNHIVSLLNVEGTTTNLNHAVYSGTCSNLVQLYCSAANSLTSNNTNFIIGQTYFLRVWSNGSNSEVVTFNVCVKPVSSCQTAAPFCGGSVTNPYIFANTTGVPNTGRIACLGTTPNPTYYTLQVGQTGPLNFTMYQNTNIGTNGELLGTGLDVDYVAWGPFTSTESCDQIVFGPCSGACPSNTSNPNFYPSGNIVDCSYSGQPTETISIPNAQAGEYYIILITNFNGAAGFIKLVQTNFNANGAGVTNCCDVKLGPDVTACSNSTVLNALAGVTDLNNVPNVFEWYFNGVRIQDQDQSTLVVTEAGTYTVKGNCGLNPVEDSILVTISPAINVVSPPDYRVCDTAPFDGFAKFNLNTLTLQVLGTLLEPDYNVTYHLLEADAVSGTSGEIDLAVPFTNTVAFNQIIYIRVESSTLGSCYAVVPVNLKVNAFKGATFEYAAVAYCKNETPNPQPIYSNGGVGGAFTASPAGLVFVGTAGEINLTASASGSYVVTNSVAGEGVCASEAFSFNVTIDEPKNARFTYAKIEYCLNDTSIVQPIFTGTATAGRFTATPNGIVINPQTGVINLGTSAAGTYLISNKVDAANACTEDVKTFTLTLFTPSNATIGYEDPYCASASTSELVTITGTSGGKFSSSAGLTIDANSGTINPSTSLSGTYVVTYTINEGNVCGVFATSTEVVISQDVVIDFTQGCENNAYKLVAVPFNDSFDVKTSTFVWTGDVTATAEPNVVILGSNGVYSVRITNAEGCSATETTNVNNVSCTIQKGISPNNDGQNDFFDLSGLNVKELFIYNRYGTEVYKFGSYTKQWKGQSNAGMELPDGTYFYVIHTLEGENITGWIFINR